MFGTSQSISGRIGTTRFTMEGFQIWEMLFFKLEPNFEMHSFLKSSLLLSNYFIYENQKMEVIKSSCGENEKVGVKCWKWRRCCGFPSNIGTQKNWSLLSFDVFRIRYFFNCMLQRYPHRNFDFVKETMPQRCCQYSSNCSAVPFDCVFMWIVFISSSKNSLPTETSIAINVMCTRNNCGPWKTKLFQVHFIEECRCRMQK